MEQPTIFGDHFETEFRIRRRSLLPTFLKVYIWIGFVLSVIFLVAISFALAFVPSLTETSLSMYALAGVASMALLFSGIIFSMTAALWFELKWAIRYNWIMGGIWVAMLIFSSIMGTVQISQINGAVLTIPYWIMIYKIQHRWEREAVSKKDLKTKL